MMDLREATACFDEHRISLAAISGMLKPNVAEGEAGQAVEKFNARLVETLNSQLQHAVILSIVVCEEMKETPEQLLEFPSELADFFVALNQLRLNIDKATEVGAEYRRQAEAANKEKERGAGVSEGIQRFLRSIGWMSDEEAREEMNMLAKKAELASNTPDQLEICAAAETVAPGSEAEAEIRTESLESPAQVPTIPAKNAAREQITRMIPKLS